MARKLTHGVVVVGLGRFGRSLALELMTEDVDVLGIDADPRVVKSLAGRLTHVVEADSTDAEAMRELSVGDFDRAVIGVGTDIEASILSASMVVDLGVPNVWAKAISQSHARILTKVGVHHVDRRGKAVVVGSAIGDAHGLGPDAEGEARAGLHS